ncbi:hypothetical protein [Sinorhizobium fredii]|nr:hypothetical protein [Sinorhizobium fredii]
MKKEQIIAVLKEQEVGAKVAHWGSGLIGIGISPIGSSRIRHLAA